jgi:hypothetical protein
LHNRKQNINIQANGFFKGPVGFFEDAEKVVVGSIDRRIDPFGSADHIGWKHGACPLYLYPILVMDHPKKISFILGKQVYEKQSSFIPES